MSNEDPCLHFEARLVPDLRTKIKKRLIAAICDLKQPCTQCVLSTFPFSELDENQWLLFNHDINGSASEDVKLVPNSEINDFAAKCDLIQISMHGNEDDVHTNIHH